MCRLAAYVGPPIPLSALLYDPPICLSEQAASSRERCSGRINVDGTGVAWWDGEDPRPLRYRTDRPPWADENLRGLASRLVGTVQLAAVRSATPGIPHGQVFAHPFAHGGVAGAHNGWISAFRAHVARSLLARLPDHLFGAFDGMSDSLALFLLAVTELEHNPADGLVGALRAALAATAEECRRAGATAVLNLALADARGVAIARTGYKEPGSSLYVLRDSARWPSASLAASEPLDDDPGWAPVPDRHIAVLNGEGMEITAID
ncbi:MAG: ergothioneine biosynthesis protein EgtC [Egibacteraceae bacterium]